MESIPCSLFKEVVHLLSETDTILGNHSESIHKAEHKSNRTFNITERVSFRLFRWIHASLCTKGDTVFRRVYKTAILPDFNKVYNTVILNARYQCNCGSMYTHTVWWDLLGNLDHSLDCYITLIKSLVKPTAAGSLARDASEMKSRNQANLRAIEWFYCWILCNVDRTSERGGNTYRTSQELVTQRAVWKTHAHQWVTLIKKSTIGESLS